MKRSNKKIGRRDFIYGLGGALIAAEFAMHGCKDESSTMSDTGSDSGNDDSSIGPKDNGKSKVFVVKSTDRKSGVIQAMTMAGLGFAAGGREVVLKPNFNTSDPAPGSTHDDTIRQIVTELKNAGSGKITMAESSGPGGTANVIREKGTPKLCSELGIDFVDYDTIPESEWETFQIDGMHWPNGLAIPNLIRSDRAVVLMPCCKTHFIGEITMSLKLAVGLVPKNRRMEMHADSLHERIAEINKGFEPDLIVMDAVECFIDGGPTVGTRAAPGLTLAATDRIALDAVGMAVLKAAGSKTDALRNKIFAQSQIVRAVELGLGATSPDEIELVGDDTATVSELRSILDNG
jgi:uncharacterized protein (DUF362 family)